MPHLIEHGYTYILNQKRKNKHFFIQMKKKKKKEGNNILYRGRKEDAIKQTGEVPARNKTLNPLPPPNLSFFSPKFEVKTRVFLSASTTTSNHGGAKTIRIP